MLVAPKITPSLLGRGILGDGLLVEPLWSVAKLLRYYVLSRGGVQFAMQEPSGVVALATNPAVDLGRDLVINGGFANWTGDDPDGWDVTESPPNAEIKESVAGNQCRLISDGTLARIINNNTTIESKTYDYSFDIIDDSGGAIKFANGGQVLESVSTPGSYSGSFTGSDSINIAFFTNTAGTDITIDNVILKQTNIAASSAFPGGVGNPLNGDITGATVGVNAGRFLDLAYSFDGSGNFVDMLSPELTSIINLPKFTVGCYIQIDPAVWADATRRVFTALTVDADNGILLEKTAVANQLRAAFIAGGTTKEVLTTAHGGSANNLLFMFTVDMVEDEMKAFLNGPQVGVTQAGLGTFVGNLQQAVIGALNDTPNSPHSGLVTEWFLINDVIPVSEGMKLARAGGVA